LQLSVCSQICQKPAEPELQDDLNMESQLNPDAAEFVPSPTQMMSPMEEIFLAQSPSVGIKMEDIVVPSQLDFQDGVSQRPNDVDVADKSSELSENKPPSKLPDLISSKVNDLNPFISSLHLENEGVFSNILEQEQQNIFPDQQNINVKGFTLDESEVTSTKAEFGDDSVSFLTTGSELQKTVTESVLSVSSIENSFTDSNLLETELHVSESDSDNNELFRFNDVKAGLNKSTVEETALHEEGNLVPENAIPVCFEVQKELIPEMESKPERVELDSEGASSADDSGSPLHAEDKQLEESTTISQVPDSTVTSPILNLHHPVPEELTVTSQVQEPSLQDTLASYEELTATSQAQELSLQDILASPEEVTVTSQVQEPSLNDTLATDVPSQPVEYPVSHLEAETVSSQPLQSPISTPQAFWSSTTVPHTTQEGVSEASENQTQDTVPQFEAEDYLRKIPHSPPVVSGIQEQLFSKNFPRATPDEVFATSEQNVVIGPRIEEELGKCQEMEVNGLLLDPFGNATSQCDVTDPRQHPVEAEVKETEVVEKLLPAPVHVSEEMPQLSNVEPPAPAESVQVSEKVVDEESEGGLVTAAAAATVATAVAAGTIVAHEKPAEEAKKPEKNVEAKKPTPSKDKKESAAVKAKVTKTSASAKSPIANTGTTRVLQKSKLTSPTKPPSTTFRSSTPKKLVPSVPPAGETTKSPANANKPKPAVTSPTKPLSPAVKPASPSPHPRTGTTSTKSAILSNGEVAKPTVSKKATAPAAARPQSRPATAPATTKAGTTKQSGAVTSRSVPVSSTSMQYKPRAADGSVSKSRPTGTVASTMARNKVGSTCDTKIVKDKKETVNKQFSTVTATSKSTITSTRITVAAATRRVPGVTKSTAMSPVGKAGPKKSTSTRTISGTRTTASTKTTKTEVMATSENKKGNEIVHLLQVD
jgi:hypothetical protein